MNLSDVLGRLRKQIQGTSAFANDIAFVCDYAEKADAEITRLRNANDELFQINQNIVIANRELMHRNHDLQRVIDDFKRRNK